MEEQTILQMEVRLRTMIRQVWDAGNGRENLSTGEMRMDYPALIRVNPGRYRHGLHALRSNPRRGP